MNADQLVEAIQKEYGAQAKRAAKGGRACCGTGETVSDIALYDEAQRGELPVGAALASLGCGNPTALAELKPGETVLDLGSGGGIDVLLSAKRVGPTGFAYGLDMTDEMLALAEQNRREAGLDNVKFLKGRIEEVPLHDDAVDVVISNCVINLSVDKELALREAFRVLKPGGRFAVSDIVLDGELPQAVSQDLLAYIGCVAGALPIPTFEQLLEKVGFTNVEIVPVKRYTIEDAGSCGLEELIQSKLSPEEAAQIDGKIVSAFVRATKPV